MFCLSSCEWLDAAVFCCLQHSDLSNKIHIHSIESVRYRNVKFKTIIILRSGHFTLKVITCFNVVLEVYWLFRCMYVFDSQRCAEAISSRRYAHLPVPVLHTIFPLRHYFSREDGGSLYLRSVSTFILFKYKNTITFEGIKFHLLNTILLTYFVLASVAEAV